MASPVVVLPLATPAIKRSAMGDSGLKCGWVVAYLAGHWLLYTPRIHLNSGLRIHICIDPRNAQVHPAGAMQEYTYKFDTVEDPEIQLVAGLEAGPFFVAHSCI